MWSARFCVSISIGQYLEPKGRIGVIALSVKSIGTCIGRPNSISFNIASSGETESTIYISSDSSSSDEEESLVKTTVTRVTNRPKTASTRRTNDDKELKKDTKERDNGGVNKDCAKDGKAGTSKDTFDTMSVDRDDAKKSIIESFSSVEEDDRFPSQGTQ